MIVLGIILIILGLAMASWTYNNNQRPPGYRPGVFETELGGCMVNFIPLCLLGVGIYILVTL